MANARKIFGGKMLEEPSFPLKLDSIPERNSVSLDERVAYIKRRGSKRWSFVILRGIDQWIFDDAYLATGIELSKESISLKYTDSPFIPYLGRWSVKKYLTKEKAYEDILKVFKTRVVVPPLKQTRHYNTYYIEGLPDSIKIKFDTKNKKWMVDILPNFQYNILIKNLSNVIFDTRKEAISALEYTLKAQIHENHTI